MPDGLSEQNSAHNARPDGRPNITSEMMWLVSSKNILYLSRVHCEELFFQLLTQFLKSGEAGNVMNLVA
jgi:hypothetical protein